jgi:hypothetical protein
MFVPPAGRSRGIHGQCELRCTFESNFDLLVALATNDSIAQVARHLGSTFITHIHGKGDTLSLIR